MKFLSLTTLTLFLTISASAKDSGVKTAGNFSQCNIQMNGFNGLAPAYKIDDDGDLSFNQKDKRVVSWDAAGQTLVYQDLWGDKPATNKTKIKMVKEGGRPVAIESTYISTDKSPVAWPGALGEQASRVSFGYNGDRCYVKEASFRSGDKGKEYVTYDHELCGKLLALAKRTTAKKLAECKSTFAAMDSALKEFNKNQAGREFMAGMPGIPVTSNGLGQAPDMSDWNALAAIGSCNLTRSFYGMPVDEETNSIAPYAIGIGGGIMPYGPSTEQKSGPAN